MAKKLLSGKWRFLAPVLGACFFLAVVFLDLEGEFLKAEWLFLGGLVIFLFLTYSIVDWVKESGIIKKKKAPQIPGESEIPASHTERKRIHKILTTIEADRNPEVVGTLLQAIYSKRIWARETAYHALLKIRFPEAVKPLLEALDTLKPKAKDIAIEVLGEIADAKAVPALVKEADIIAKKNILSRYPHLEGTLRKIRGNMTTEEGLLCGFCFEPYKKFHESCVTYGVFDYCACGNCGSDAFRVPAKEKIVLYVDRGLKERYKVDDERVYINWFQLKRPFDFDEIEIRAAQDEDIEELVMVLMNDMDDKRRTALAQKPVTITGNFQLSPAKQNLLKDNFDFDYMI